MRSLSSTDIVVNLPVILSWEIRFNFSLSTSHVLFSGYGRSPISAIPLEVIRKLLLLIMGYPVLTLAAMCYGQINIREAFTAMPATGFLPTYTTN